ncbi:MAG: ATPase, T2SS/T4P/T4SS family [Planctomycetota bacterium]|nr:ATPase, T2SS/T4P/T4SS family [Planctomycetota bacterium]
MVSFNRRIVRILEETGMVEMDVLTAASQVAKQGETSVTEYLLEKEHVKEGELLGVLAEHLGVPPIDLDKVKIQDETLDVMSHETAKETGCLPICRTGNVLTIAVSNPFDVVRHDDLRLSTGCDLRLALALEPKIEEAITRTYTGDTGNLSEILDAVDDPEMKIREGHSDEEDDVVELGGEGNDGDAPVIKIVNLIIYNAIKSKASDIHIEAFEKRVLVRYRIDGALEPAMEPPKKLQKAIISRLKIMASLDIAERRKPQDGKFQVKAEGRQIDFRVSTLPCVHGEKVVLRILDGGNLALSLEKLGFEEKALNDFREAINSPYGMILVTGPTGSGKTTTLYSAVKEIMTPEDNFVTVEDPVEYQVDGINQVQVNVKSGLTFAAALRSILRQDPDTVMIGEIRDPETIDIAIKAALTGHLVLSTLHTNDAASTISRMIDMGVDPFMVASATLLVSAQRLVRRLCKRCCEPVEVKAEKLLSMGYTEAEVKEGVTLYRAVGCNRCSAGYAGRFALLETLPVTEAIKRMIIDGHSAIEIRHKALEEGMISLRRAALLNAMRGNTSVEEVLRVTLAENVRPTFAGRQAAEEE